MKGSNNVMGHATPVDAQWVAGVPVANVVSSPSAPMAPTTAPLSSDINEIGAREFLQGHSWPKGLIDLCIKNFSKCPVRYIICDDSGSMNANDGHRFVTLQNGNPKNIPCTRWAELTQDLKFQSGLVAAANAETTFCFLNSSQPITIGGGAPVENVGILEAVLSGSPGGGTPLCEQIRQIIPLINQRAAQLRASNQLAVIVICSDGESSDGDISSAMTPLSRLPVWVVIRLCTDDDRVVSYWNNIDSQLEVNLDVLDDWTAEAEEVTTANPWLTYGEPLHKLREIGIPVKEFDLLDSMLLSMEQTQAVMAFVFGGSKDDYPHPAVDWDNFIQCIVEKNKQTGKVWNVKRNRYNDWIDVKKLATAHGKGVCSIS